MFLDPPYLTTHNLNGFVDYNARLFSWDDQHRLAEHAESARRRKVSVIVAAPNHESVLSLYPNFEAHEVARSSTLASDPRFRGAVSEVLLVGHK